jgi:hypothetical protein
MGELSTVCGQPQHHCLDPAPGNPMLLFPFKEGAASTAPQCAGRAARAQGLPQTAGSHSWQPLQGYV